MRKSKYNQGLAPVILIVLLVAAAVVVYGGIKIIKKPANLPGSQPVLVENFDKTGNLTDWDSNTERQTGDWILLYDEPGRLAIVAKLAFNALSKCDLGSGEEVCDKNKLELGAVTRVQGNQKGEIVTVIKLTKLAGP